MMDGEQCLKRMVEMVIEGNSKERHLVEAELLQGSSMSPIFLPISTCGLIKLVEEYVSAKQQCLVDDLSCLATGSDLNQFIIIVKTTANFSSVDKAVPSWAHSAQPHGRY
jgi:hypothetical protein